MASITCGKSRAGQGTAEEGEEKKEEGREMRLLAVYAEALASGNGERGWAGFGLPFRSS